jgi:hypothetical protein
MSNPTPFRPRRRYESFAVYENLDGHSFHIIAVSGGGGHIFADGFNSRQDAEWTAALLNAAVGVNLSKQPIAQ